MAEDPAPRRSKLRVLLGLVLVIVALVVTVIASGIARGIAGPVAEAFVGLISMTVFLFTGCRFSSVTREELGLVPPRGRAFGVGTLGGVVCVAAAFGISMLAGAYRVELSSAPSFGFVASIVVATLVHAVFEEVAFRSGIVGLASTAFSRAVAITIPAVLFAMAHMLNPGAAVLGIVNTFLLGIALGMMFFIAGKPTLGECSGWHFGWNLAVAFVGTPVSGNRRDLWLHSEPAGGSLWTGDAYGLEATLSCTIVSVLLVAWLAWRAQTGVSPAHQGA